MATEHHSLFRESSGHQTGHPRAGAAASPRGWGALPRAFVSRVLSRLPAGQLAVHLPDGTRLGDPACSTTIVMHRWRALVRLLTKGSIGFAEAYIDGDWDTPDLPALLEMAARHEQAFARELAGTRLARLSQRWWHRTRENTREGSRGNIEAHYDLGNAFYAAWLDEGMSYSSAWFEDEGMSLEAAQETKQARVVDRLSIAGGERVLEIGCGWGGLATRLAATGCHVTGLTLSPSQLAHARARVDAAGLTAHADLRLQDYRDVTGSFDRIVSIEMLEAVGERYWPAFFATLRARLVPGGVAVVQVICIDDARFDTYRREVDFIQRHVFPGGMLPSDAAMREQIARADLRLAGVETFGASYARTLAKWRVRFQHAWSSIRAQGFDERFRRRWEYYLAYCEAGFRAGALDVGLYRIERPGPRP